MHNGKDTLKFTYLGHLLRRSRELMDLTQEELAEAVGKSKRHIAGIEGGNIPSADLLCSLVRTLGVPGDKVFYPETTAPSNRYVEKREIVSRLLNRCSEAQLSVTIALLSSMLRNEVPTETPAIGAAEDSV